MHLNTFFLRRGLLVPDSKASMAQKRLRTPDLCYFFVCHECICGSGGIRKIGVTHRPHYSMEKSPQSSLSRRVVKINSRSGCLGEDKGPEHLAGIEI
jgi:hypothetical protein